MLLSRLGRGIFVGRRCQNRNFTSTVQTKLKATLARKKVVSAGLLESWTKDGIINSAASLPEAPPADVAPLDKKPASSRRKKSKQKETQDLILSGEPPPQFLNVSTQLAELYQDYTESRDLVDRYLDDNPLPKSDDISYEQQIRAFLLSPASTPETWISHQQHFRMRRDYSILAE